MSKKRLFEDIKQNPTRIYRSPADVLRDRRFGDSERLEILRTWHDSHAHPDEQDEIAAMIVDVETRVYSAASDHAAE